MRTFCRNQTILSNLAIIVYLIQKAGANFNFVKFYSHLLELESSTMIIPLSTLIASTIAHFSSKIRVFSLIIWYLFLDPLLM